MVVISVFYCKPILAETPLVNKLDVGILNFSPLFNVHSDRMPSGPMSDILFQTLQKTNLSYRYTVYPAKRLFNNLVSGNTDVSVGVIANHVYGRHVLYSEKPIGDIELRIFTIGAQPLPIELADILGKHVAVVRGYSYGGRKELLVQAANKRYIHQFNTVGDALDRLKNGRVTFMLGYKKQVGVIEKKSPTKLLRSAVIETLQIYFIVAKANPQAAQIMQLMEQNYWPK